MEFQGRVLTEVIPQQKRKATFQIVNDQDSQKIKGKKILK